MTEPAREEGRQDPPEGSWEGTRLRQLRRGLEMTMAERLEWLEQMVESMRQIKGKAREARKASPRPDETNTPREIR